MGRRRRWDDPYHPDTERKSNHEPEGKAHDNMGASGERCEGINSERPGPDDDLKVISSVIHFGFRKEKKKRNVPKQFRASDQLTS